MPPTVAWSFLLASSSPPNIDGPASTAIWANCQVGDNSSDLPTSSNFSTSTFLLSISPGVGGASSKGASAAWTSAHILTLRVLLPFPFGGVNFILAMLEVKENQPIRSQSSFTKVMWYFVLNWLLHISKILTWVQAAQFTTYFSTMSEELSKYAKILERQNKEFKRVMWEEVSITSVPFHFPLNLTAK